MNLLTLAAFCSFAVLTSADNWGSFERDSCVGNGLRQYSSALHGIPLGESWESRCASSPHAVVEGQTFDRPSRCVNVGPGIDVWGYFDVEDASCLNKETGATNPLERTRNLYDDGVFNQGNELYRGYKLNSKSFTYRLDMQLDGNLVIYRRSDWKALWYTDTWKKNSDSMTGSYATLQTDGNFVVYGFGNGYRKTALWASHTKGLGENYLKMQDDGNLVIYTKGTNVPQWSSGTNQPRPTIPNNLRTRSLNSTHVANNSAVRMQGTLPHTLVKFANLDKDAVSADGVGVAVAVGAPDQASKSMSDSTN